MLISTIVLIVVRLFSVSWLVQGLSMLAVAFGDFSKMDSANNGAFVTATFLPSVGLITFCVVTWIISPFLARLIAGKHDASVTVPSLSLLDLYSFAFVFLGLYFILNSLGNVFNWAFYWFVVNASHGDFDPEQKKSFYGLSRYVVTLLAGFACLLSGRKWARKLHDSESET
jgi:hypothetical protein